MMAVHIFEIGTFKYPKKRCLGQSENYPMIRSGQSAQEYSLLLKNTSNPKLKKSDTQKLSFKNHGSHRFQNCFDTSCQSGTVWSSGDCLCQKMANNFFFFLGGGVRRFQKFNFDCLLLKLLNCSPRTEKIPNMLCPLWTWYFT